MSTKLSFQITDIESDITSPNGEKVLNVGIVGKTMFLTVMNATETNKERRLEVLQEVAINTESFLLGLDAAIAASEVDQEEGW